MSENNRLLRSTPEEQGIPSQAILSFVEGVEKSGLGLHSFMLLRHGHVVAEGWWSPYGPQRPHMLFSLSKSFTSTAIGLAVSEGRLSVDDKVISFFPDDVPESISENLASMRVRHLLSMSTGHAEDTTGYLHEQKEGNWVKGFLDRPVDHEPGTHFVYNSGATYMLSAIVQKVTGQKLVDYLQPRLFEPLGIKDATWEECPRGINTGGWGLSIRTEDIARFGQMYLQKGMWNGKRILPQAWVEEATSSHISNGDGGASDWAQGYGYQFWRCRHGAYRGDGAFGQFCIVMPQQDAIMAITSGVDDMQAVMNLVWERLLPAMGNSDLPGDDSAREILEQKLSGLALLPPQVQADSPVAGGISGKRFEMDENEIKLQYVSFRLQEDTCIFTVQGPWGEHQVRCGIEKWMEGETTIMGGPMKVAASSTWTDDHTLVMTLCYYETPFINTMTCRFEGDNLDIKFVANVSFGPKEQAALKGRMM